MEVFAKQKGLEYHYQESEERFVIFQLTNSNWQGKCWIGFTFEENRCHYGICNNPNTYRISEENRKILHEHLNEIGIHNGRESNWWPFYAYYTNLSLETWESEIINSDIFLNDCKEKIEKLLTAMEGITFLEPK